jgi:thiamine biosynthesis protein ThiI
VKRFKVVCLLSGGIDSPVAACLMGRRGADVVLLHMDNSLDEGDVSIDKAKNLARAIRSSIGRSVTLYVAPHSRNQRKISETCDRGFQCVLCKMLMLRVAKGLCEAVNADAIVTGESLGQVASQTLHNIRVEEHWLDFPVLRPLIGIDKLEIEAIAKEIDTYDISIRTTAPCRFVPSKPVTMARVSNVAEECTRIDVEEMISYAVQSRQEIPFD